MHSQKEKEEEGAGDEKKAEGSGMKGADCKVKSAAQSLHYSKYYKKNESGTPKKEARILGIKKSLEPNLSIHNDSSLLDLSMS